MTNQDCKHTPTTSTIRDGDYKREGREIEGRGREGRGREGRGRRGEKGRGERGGGEKGRDSHQCVQPISLCSETTQ